MIRATQKLTYAYISFGSFLYALINILILTYLNRVQTRLSSDRVLYTLSILSMSGFLFAEGNTSESGVAVRTSDRPGSGVNALVAEFLAIGKETSFVSQLLTA